MHGAPVIRAEQMLASTGDPTAIRHYDGVASGRRLCSATGGVRHVRPMVEEVRIQNLGVIEEAVLELSPGFNVVTGAPGAGKTMVVPSLGLLFGGRAAPRAPPCPRGRARLAARCPGGRAAARPPSVRGAGGRCSRGGGWYCP